MDRDPSILVVEDDLDTLELVAELLELEGYVVARATNGRQALDRIAAMPAPPCLILLDLMMPVMNGWEFLGERERDEALCSIDVVLLTAYGDLDEVRRDSRVAAVLEKPLAAETLLRTTHRFCPMPARRTGTPAT